LPGIEEDAPADLVAFREDPREDLSVLADPVLVILDGRLVRDPASSR
jgi:imidazolonepropionase-like amidohydrolase